MKLELRIGSELGLKVKLIEIAQMNLDCRCLRSADL